MTSVHLLLETLKKSDQGWTQLLLQTIFLSLMLLTRTEFSMKLKFEPLKESQIRDLINSMAKKSCALDPVPSHLLISCLDVLLPVITKMVNLSLETGQFPNQWKMANVNPLLKKQNLAPTFQNPRPISNLSFNSKLTERVVADQIKGHMTANRLYPLLQSA